jgi:hypothetical protein
LIKEQEINIPFQQDCLQSEMDVDGDFSGDSDGGGFPFYGSHTKDVGTQMLIYVFSYLILVAILLAPCTITMRRLEDFKERHGDDKLNDYPGSQHVPDTTNHSNGTPSLLRRLLANFLLQVSG